MVHRPSSLSVNDRDSAQHTAQEEEGLPIHIATLPQESRPFGAGKRTQ